MTRSFTATEVVIAPGADHFLSGSMHVIKEAAERAVRAWLDELGDP